MVSRASVAKGQRLCGLTFELSGRQRQDARPGLAKMYRVPPDRAWWPAVGAPLERGVRPQPCVFHGSAALCLAMIVSSTYRRSASGATLMKEMAIRLPPDTDS